jgi:hypothetical protein
MKDVGKKRTIIFTLIIAVSISVFYSWLNWTRGKIVAWSDCPFGHRKVIIRSVPFTRNPFYMIMPLHSRFYRCEYYWKKNNILISSQSYSEDSYIAENFKIVWDGKTKATVSFDGEPALLCDSGWWEKL